MNLGVSAYYWIKFTILCFRGQVNAVLLEGWLFFLSASTEIHAMGATWWMRASARGIIARLY